MHKSWPIGKRSTVGPRLQVRRGGGKAMTSSTGLPAMMPPPAAATRPLPKAAPWRCDVDGAGFADFEIGLSSAPGLTAGNFILWTNGYPLSGSHTRVW
jgi:hypothetical protein